MKTVTYEGPTDPADPTTRYITADGEHRFPKGAEVSDIPDEVAKELVADENHNFKVQSSKGSAADKNTTKED